MHRDVEQIYSIPLEFAVASFLGCDLSLLVFPSILPLPATSLPSAPHFLRLEKPKEVIYCPVQTGLQLITSHLEVIFPLVVPWAVAQPPWQSHGAGQGCGMCWEFLLGAAFGAS